VLGSFVGGFVGRANGHSNELFFPGTVKSCSRTVDRDVRRADNRTLLLVPDILVDPVVPPKPERQCAAHLPSRIATAVCCFEVLCCRCGKGTKPARSGVVTWRFGGSCSFAKVLEISGSDGAYLSASIWYYEELGQ
jgi:hypothetical protein